MKRFVAAILMIVLFVTCGVLSSYGEGKTILIKSIKIKDSKIKLPLNETITLAVEIKPDNASNKELEWSSSDENVCVVNKNGEVVAVGFGKCTIECVATDGSKKKHKVDITTFVPDPPILFRNIPWGSNMEESIELGELADNTIWFETPSAYDDWYTVDALNGLVHHGDCDTGYDVMLLRPNIEVAGYNTDYVRMIYAYGIENEEIIKDKEKAQLVFGQYDFMLQTVKENQNAVKDLTKKLTELYGKPDKNGKPEKKGIVTGNQKYKHTTWYDDYGNRVVLSYTNYGFRINYVWSKADDVLQKINDMLKPPVVDQSGNKKGL